MKGPLRTYRQMTFEDLPNATFLRASEDGQSPLSLPDGPPTDPVGPARAPASHFRKRAKAKAKKTPATSGPTSSASSASAILQCALVSRLKARLQSTGGSIEYRLTWRDAVTPSGRPYCLLRASTVRTC